MKRELPAFSKWFKKKIKKKRIFIKFRSQRNPRNSYSYLTSVQGSQIVTVSLFLISLRKIIFVCILHFTSDVRPSSSRWFLKMSILSFFRGIHIQKSTSLLLRISPTITLALVWAGRDDTGRLIWAETISSMDPQMTPNRAGGNLFNKILG